MNKLISTLIALVIILEVSSLITVLPQIQVGVKEGDWIEYKMNYNGSVPDTYPKYIRIDITKVEGIIIQTIMKLENLDGTSNKINFTYNLQSGVPDLLIVPANLNENDEFLHKDFGNVQIAGTNEYTYAEAKRTINYANVNEILFHWDRKTGICLKSTHSTVNFTQEMVVNKTNLWQPQILGLDLTIFYALLSAILLLITLIGFIILRKLRK